MQTWVDRLFTIAEAGGYGWSKGEIGAHCKLLVERLGEERTAQAWTWWVQNALTVGESRSRMNPRAFARHAGYWLHLSNPVTYDG